MATRNPRRPGAATTATSTLAAVLLLAGGSVVGGVSPAPAAPADEVPATGGTLEWGFKQSWRNYTGGDHEMSDGATRDAAGVMTFPLTGGGYDPVDQVTRLEFGGSAHFDAHPEGDIHLLDMTMSSPHLTISRDVQVLSMEIVSRQFLPPHDFVDFGRVDIATVDIGDAAPTVADGTTTWPRLPTNISGFAATEVFGAYTPGQALDRLSFTYQGPGGAPDFSERWDVPGSVTLTPRTNVMLDPADLQNGTSYNVFHVDQRNQVAYDLISEVTGVVPPATVTVRQSLRAFDLATMELLDRTTVYTGDQATSLRFAPSFVDTTTGRMFLQRLDGTVTSWIRWDPATRQYATGEATVPFPADFTTALWDPVGERAVNVQYTGADEDRAWSLHTYTEGTDGAWSEQASYPLPDGPEGLNHAWYRTNLGPGSHSTAVAADGSLIMTRDRIGAPAGGTPPDTVSALRLLIGDSGVTVREVPGSAMPNVAHGPYSHVYAGPDGQVTLTRRGYPLEGVSSKVQNLVVAADGSGAEPVSAEPRGGQADLGTMTLDGVAIDPVDGTVWLRGGETRTLAAVRDGAVIYQGSFDYLNRLHSALVVGSDHRVYTQTFDPEATDFGVKTFGWASFDPTGSSPAVTRQPDGALVALPSGAAEATVSFTAAATGDPDPDVRWQVRPAGATTFSDLDGEHDPTLRVTATAEDHGTEYRAVFSNAAGALASDVARLTVHYEPSVNVQPAASVVAAGEPVSFQVLASGSPEPTVQWQRQVDGTWTDTAGAAGSTHEIGEATVDMSGSRFRARVENPVGTVFSDPTTLTVTGGGPDPGAGEQQVVVSVPEVAGELVWQIDGTGRTVAMGTAEDRGDHWYAAGDLLPVTVADTRTGGPAWSVSGQVSDFTGGPDPGATGGSGVSGSYLGWTPAVLSPGAGAGAGPPVPPGSGPASGSGPGLSEASLLGSAPDGHDPGTTTLGAGLEARLPATTAAGTYTATLTITAIG